MQKGTSKLLKKEPILELKEKKGEKYLKKITGLLEVLRKFEKLIKNHKDKGEKKSQKIIKILKREKDPACMDLEEKKQFYNLNKNKLSNLYVTFKKELDSIIKEMQEISFEAQKKSFESRTTLIESHKSLLKTLQEIIPSINTQSIYFNH